VVLGGSVGIWRQPLILHRFCGIHDRSWAVDGTALLAGL